MNNLYPAKFEETFEQHQSTGFVVTFRDVPEAITQGNDFADSVDMSEDALKCAMEFYTERGEDYPRPSLPLSGEVMIELKIV